jgi:hypothetical protein
MRNEIIGAEKFDLMRKNGIPALFTAFPEGFNISTRKQPIKLLVFSKR